MPTELDKEKNIQHAREAAYRQTLLDLLPCGLIRYNARTQEFNFVSENTLRMLGYTREEFDAKFSNRFDLLVWPEDRARVLREIDEQIALSNDDTCEYRIEKKDGTLCWVYDIGHLHADENGGEFYVSFTDMTRQTVSFGCITASSSNILGFACR